MVLEETPTTPSPRAEYLEASMYQIIDWRTNTVAAIEAQQAMPKQGVRSMFSIGLGFGLWRGLLAGMQIPYEIVRPQEWRRVVGLPRNASKGDAAALAQRLYPEVGAELVGPRGGLRDGLADALLIAHWRRLTYERTPAEIARRYG
jgi:hypothetical protein